MLRGAFRSAKKKGWIYLGYKYLPNECYRMGGMLLQLHEAVNENTSLPPRPPIIVQVISLIYFLDPSISFVFLLII